MNVPVVAGAGVCVAGGMKVPQARLNKKMIPTRIKRVQRFVGRILASDALLRYNDKTIIPTQCFTVDIIYK